MPELSRLRRGNQSDAGAEKRPAAAPLAGDLPSGSRSPHRTIRHACVRRACLGARNRQVTGIQDNQDSAPPFDTENDHENHPLSRPGFVCAFGHRGSARPAPATPTHAIPPSRSPRRPSTKSNNVSVSAARSARPRHSCFRLSLRQSLEGRQALGDLVEGLLVDGVDRHLRLAEQARDRRASRPSRSRRASPAAA